MKLGEKLQQLRKKSGLSQEQLAARLTVSRQAVSKWELDETMPDTENVIQLSRLFGVSCDYLLREEVDEQCAAPSAPAQTESQPQPAAPGERHLDEAGWTHNALIVSLAVCVVGLILAIGDWFTSFEILLPIGLAVQVLGIVLFELAAPRMGKKRCTARWIFYVAVCWLVPPALFWLIPGMGMTGGLYYSLFLAVPVTVITLLVLLVRFLLRRKK